jgi:hypothetical protein
MTLEDGRLYTPDEVSANGWLGSDTTPGALRKAASRGRIDFTRFQGRIYFTAANIRANQEAGREQAQSRRPQSSALRRGRRIASTPEFQPGVPLLRSRPDARRRKAS